MKPVTLRNMSPEIVRVVLQKAKKNGASLNKTVLTLLEEYIGVRYKKKTKTVHHDLDRLAGSWTREEAKPFDNALIKQRPIDSGLWK